MITDEKLKEDVTAWLRLFLEDHFPEGVPDDMHDALCHTLLDAYADGMRYGQEIAEVAVERSRIIRPRVQ